MATVSKEFAQELIEGNGFCKEFPDDGAPDNPPAVRIVKYMDQGGKVVCGVVFAHERNKTRYEIESEFVRNPKVIWTRE